MKSVDEISLWRCRGFETLLLMVLVFSWMAMVGTAQAGTKNGFELSDSLVPEAEIFKGGPPRDGIPAIDKPLFTSAAKAGIASDDMVMGVSLNGIAKAYPLRILNRHEVVNDTFAQTGVVISFCPLCGSGVVFLLPQRQGASGSVTSSPVTSSPVTSSSITSTFGVSGLLYNSDVLLYDRESESLWSQLMLKAISGRRKGETLTLLAATLTSWAEWQRRYPNTLLLSETTNAGIAYGRDPYAGYKKSQKLWFPVKAFSDALPTKERVLGLSINGVDKAYPHSELRQAPAELVDFIGGQKVRIIWSENGQSAYALDENGEQIAAVTAYWFAWFGFHPQTQIYRANN